MYIFETYNPIKGKTDRIISDNIIELCASVLNYNNDIEDNTGNEYIVIFNDVNGNNIITISEDGLDYAITGTVKNKIGVTGEIRCDSDKFWEINHSNVKHISFINPVRLGDAEWDEDYDESELDSESESDSYSKSESEYESNIVKLS